VRLTSLRIRNLLSFGEQPQSLDLDGSSITFIVGPNNSGKSNLFRSLSFVADCIVLGYPPADSTPYLRSGHRDFEVVVDLELDSSEVQAIRDFLVCSNMMYNPGGPEAPSMLRLKNDILVKHGGAMFADLGKEITIILKGTGRETQRFKHHFLLRWGTEEFLLQQDGYFSKQEMPDTSGFGFSPLGLVLINDFKRRYPSQFDKIKAGGPIEESYDSPDFARLLSKTLTSETTKAGQNVFAGIQSETLNFEEFDRALGATPAFRRLEKFLEEKRIDRRVMTIGGLIAAIYARSIVSVGDLRGSPPDFEFVPWEKAVQTQGLPAYGEVPRPQVTQISSADLPSTLFGLVTSGDPEDQERYDGIQREFEKFTDGLRFRVYLSEKEVMERPEVAMFKVPSDHPGEPYYTPSSEAAFLGTRVSEARKRVKAVSLQILDRESAFSARFASAGTIEVLCLLTAIIGMKNKVVLLDEPSQNLHPDFQGRLLLTLGRIVKDGSNQAIIITHSPYLLAKGTLEETWRVIKKNGTTSIINVSRELDKLGIESRKKILQQLDSADVRALLFSRGGVFVEGLSDKWILQEIDSKASKAGKGPRLVENEWAIVTMNTSGNTSTFLRLAKLIGLKFAFLLDRDAYSIVRGIIGKKDTTHLSDKTMRKNGFFLLKSDLDDVIGIKGDGKPLKALEVALGMELKGLPQELSDFMEFLSSRVSSR
jgi:AAA domain, putative AbiEii toxin, Type IV TA system/Overcoming lysogenization defect protein-like, TOPRIM domain